MRASERVAAIVRARVFEMLSNTGTVVWRAVTNIAPRWVIGGESVKLSVFPDDPDGERGIMLYETDPDDPDTHAMELALRQHSAALSAAIYGPALLLRVFTLAGLIPRQSADLIADQHASLGAIWQEDAPDFMGMVQAIAGRSDIGGDAIWTMSREQWEVVLGNSLDLMRLGVSLFEVESGGHTFEVGGSGVLADGQDVMTKPRHIQSGVPTVTTDATGVATVTYPTAFATIPRVVVTPAASSTTNWHTMQIASRSTTGFTAVYYRNGVALASTSVTFNYLAMVA